MPVADAVRETPDGCVIDVEVTPGASRDAFPAGYNPWRRRVEARVRARAEDGEANAALRRLVAERLGVGAPAVTIVRGAKDRQKTLRVAGIPRDAVVARLSGEAP